MIEKALSDQFKQRYLNEVFQCQDVRASSALYAYAGYLNKKLPQRFDDIPLYLEIFRTNHCYAIDALLNGFVARRFFDFIKVPNTYLLRVIFEILGAQQKNTLYRSTLHVFCGLLKRVYRNPNEGYRLYPTRVEDINNLGKYLDESKDQNFDTNRDILDILAFISEMDQVGQEEMTPQHVAWQANRIRSDFFDHKRSLQQSLTRVLLDKAPSPLPVIMPEGLYQD